MQEKDSILPENKTAQCLIGEMDGAMIPIVIFENNGNLDKRKWRKVGGKEARLSVVQGHKSLTRIF